LEIKPNDINRSLEQPVTLDPKIAQLLSNIASKPLLLEKLIINQPQGLLLQLTTQTNPAKNISLQLPLIIAKAFENASQVRTEVSVVITANQRVIISISQPISTTISVAQATQISELSAQPFASIKLPPQANTKISRSALSNKTLQQTIIQFRAALLLPDKIIKLLDPASPTANQLKLFKSSDGIIIPHKIVAEKAIETSNRLTTNKPSQTSLATIATQLLGKHFSKQKPVSVHLTQVKQIITQLKNDDLQSPSVNKLIQQIERLISDLKISSLPSGENIKQRVLGSGNLLENQASQQLLAKSLASKNIAPQDTLLSSSQKLTRSKTATSQSTNLQQATPLQKESSSIIPKNLRHFVTHDIKNESRENGSKVTDKTSNNSVDSKNQNPSKTPSDLKLQLMQIRATLESLIKSAGGKLASTNTSEPASPSQSGNTRLPAPLVNPEIRAQKNLELNNQSLGSQLLSNQSNKSDALLHTSQSPSSKGVAGQNTSNQKRILSLSQQNLIFKYTNELLIEVRSMISQIENNQLQSLRSDQTSIQQFLVDLPFANDPDIDSFELLFETQNDQQAAKTVKSWKVVVRFDLEPLGAMFAQIELVNERVSTHIFAETQQTATLINQYMHVLKKSLSSAGVDIDELKGSQGKIPEKLIKDDPNRVDIRV